MTSEFFSHCRSKIIVENNLYTFCMCASRIYIRTIKMAAKKKAKKVAKKKTTKKLAKKRK